MKIKCKNENCLHEWNYSGSVVRYLVCPKCVSFVPLDEYQFDLETSQQNNFKYKIRTWLLEHPEFNPYKFSSPTNSLSWYDTLFKTLTNSIRSLPNFLLIGGHDIINELSKYEIPSNFDNDIQEALIFYAKNFYHPIQYILLNDTLSLLSY